MNRTQFTLYSEKRRAERAGAFVIEDSDEEIGREFGLKVLNYYNHPNKEIAILKADLNDEYYPIEEILGGTSKELELMYNEGLSKIRNI